MPEDIPSFIKEIIFPKIRATLELSAGLEFPRNMLKPVYDVSGNNPYDPTSTGVPFDVIPEDGTTGYPKVVLRFGEALFYADTEQGLSYNMDIVLNTNVPAQIGNTGLIIDIQNLKIDLSSTKNFIEADMQGLSPEFMGVYTAYTAITLPRRWFNNIDNTTLQIAGYNMLIGTGGVSGTIALETVGGQPNNSTAYMNLKIGSWEVGFNHFDITFKQNAITQSHIAGRLKIPKLKNAQNNDAIIDITGHLNEAGDFNLTASYEEGIPLTLFNFVTFNFLTLELGRDTSSGNHFYLGTSCQIWFQNPVMAKLLGGQIIEIPRLRIYDNGSIEIVGGTGFLPLSISLNLGPIEMAVTGVHYGPTQLQYQGAMRKYNYWGFDGAISIDPLGIDVRGDGIKYYYTTDNDEFGGNGDSFIHIKTLEIDLVIPGTASPTTAIAILHGMLSIPEPGESEEYVGEVSLKIPKAKIAGSASMRLQPKYPAFIVDAAIELPAPIPLGPLGVYGFKDLLGYSYVATKEAVGLSSDDRWYDYYTHPPRGIHTSKFIGPPESLDYTAPIALGAGAVLGTSFDNGSILSARVMMVLSLPSLFMLDGRASILSSRLGLDSADEPPFYAFVAWGDSSIEMGIGADYQLPKDKGWILELYAEVQAGFHFNAPQSWYINFGTQQSPVRAKVLTLVTAQTFLMLSAQGIQAGARAEIDIRKRFGPAKVHLYAYLEIGGQISFERPQMGGYIGAGGKIEVDIWIVGLSLSLDALFAVEAAQPFLIYAELRIRPCVKIVFARICKSFTIKLKWEKDVTVNRTPISPLPQAKQSELAKGIHMLTHQSFDLNSFTTPPTISQIDKVIPLDTYIEFKTEKGLLPGAITNTIGGYTFAPENFVDLVPPKKTVRGGKQIRQVKHRYSIEAIEVKAWNGTTWVDYHPFEAIVAPDNRPEVANLKTGYWQIKDKQYDTIRLLATTPFTYLEAGEPGWHTPEVYGMTASTLYCEETTKKEDCSNMLLQDLGQKMRMPDGYLGHYVQRAYYSIGQNSGYEMVNGQALVIEEDYMEITNAINPHGFAQSLTFRNGNSLIIYLPEDAVQVKLWLTTYAQGVTIKYYATEINDQRSQVTHHLVQEEYKTAGQLQSAIEYENLSQAIIKIIIDPDQPDIERIQNIEEQIEQLFQDTYEGLSGIVKISEPKDRDQFEQLMGELDKLKNIGCTAVDSDCKKDKMLCALYGKLLDLFESCFIYPVEEKSIEDLLKQVDCFTLFYDSIFNFDRDYPEYHLIESMGELYAYFDGAWHNLKNIIGYYPEIPAGEIIAQYYYFRELSIEVMDFILKLGECDCDDKPTQVCTTSLQQVCWLSLEKHQWNLTVPGIAAIEADFEAMTEAVEKEAQPIWRPNTSYYVKCLLKDEVDNGESTPGQFSLYYGFKTVGPLGHYHKNPASNYVPSGASPDAYPLSSLRAYVDEKRSFPNINGSLLKAKPLFYGNEQCKISVFFNTPLAEHMFQRWYTYQNMAAWEGQLHIAIKDPVTNVVIPYPLPANYFERSVPVADTNGYQWVVDQHPQLPPHIQLINNLIENGDLPCRIDLGQAIKPRSRSFQVTLTNLMPQKLYTALLYNAFGTSEELVSELVHDFVFQTSRYKSFSEQINSYIIKDEEAAIQKQAVYSLSIALKTAQITKAFAIIANPNNQINDYPLANTYQDLFDRIWEGVLQIPPQDTAERTEFIKIKNSHTQEVIAIWIRNPEPFNDPKIPLNQIADMIQIVTLIGNPENEYKIVYSKDYSQALIMHSSLSLQPSSLGFKFNYYNWNGNAYEAEDTVQINDISIS